MSTPIELTPRRATLQSVALLTIFYAYIYGNAALRGSASLETTHVVAATFITGGLMLLITALLVRRDANWRESLQLRAIPVPQALAFGAVGVVFAYAASTLAMAAYAAVVSDLDTLATEKIGWATKLAGLPLWWVLPISAFAGVWEEVVFRGFLLGRLKVVFRGNLLLAVIACGVVFGIGHGYQGYAGMVQTAAAGMAFGAITVWRKSLWPAVIAHLSVDTLGLIALKVLRPMLEQVMHRVTH